MSGNIKFSVRFLVTALFLIPSASFALGSQACPVITRDLSYAVNTDQNSNGEVSNLQNFLIANNFMEKGDVTLNGDRVSDKIGYFGKYTDAGVRLFKEARGLNLNVLDARYSIPAPVDQATRAKIQYFCTHESIWGPQNISSDQKSIKINSPNSGTYSSGQSVSINITMTNLQYDNSAYVTMSTKYINAYIKNDSLGINKKIALSAVNALNNIYVAYIPTDVPTGNGYSLYMCDDRTLDATIYDSKICSNPKDFTFSIIATGSSVPTVEFLGKSKLETVYNQSTGKEDALKISSTIKITAGNSPINIISPASVASIIQLHKDNVEAFTVDTKYLQFSATSNIGDSILIPAYSSAIFDTVTLSTAVSSNFNMKFNVGTRDFKYIDSNGVQKVITKDQFKGDYLPIENSRAFSGGLVPYITNVVCTKADVSCTITGLNFSVTGAGQSVTNVISIYDPVTMRNMTTSKFYNSNQGKITFKLSDFGISYDADFNISVFIYPLYSHYFGNMVTLPVRNIFSSAPVQTPVSTPTVPQVSYNGIPLTSALPTPQVVVPPPDQTAPVITINGASTVTIPFGSVYTDAGATAYDDRDGVITSKILTVNNVNTFAAVSYTVKYNVTDSAGNKAGEVTRTVVVSPQVILDRTLPVITLVGPSIVTLPFGSSYTDAGATGQDNVDGDITSRIVKNNTVNTYIAGTYTVRYNVSDIAGNRATEVIRTVIVLPAVEVVQPIVIPPVIVPTTVAPEIVDVPAPVSLQKGTYTAYFNLSQKPFASVKGITKDAALTKCTTSHNAVPKVAIRCMWNGAQIYSFSPTAPALTPPVVQVTQPQTPSLPAPPVVVSQTVPVAQTVVETAPSVSTGVYTAFFNQSLIPFNTVNGITKEVALAKCMASHNAVPTVGIRCMWEGVQIYNFAPTTPTTPNLFQAYMQNKNGASKIDQEEKSVPSEVQTAPAVPASQPASQPVVATQVETTPTGTYTAYFNQSLVPFMTIPGITKDVALAKCLVSHNALPIIKLRCMWNGIQIYGFSQATPTVEQSSPAQVPAPVTPPVTAPQSAPAVTAPTPSVDPTQIYMLPSVIEVPVLDHPITVPATAKIGPDDYAYCTDENGVCSFTETRSVAYGANGKFFYRNITGGTSCVNTVFGDPIPGVIKSCYYKKIINTKTNYKRFYEVEAMLQNKNAPVVLGASTICLDLTRNLYRGMESGTVSSLQSFLVEKKLLDEKTGFYGDKTIQAVKDYQASKGLKITGMVFELTRQAMKNETCR